MALRGKREGISAPHAKANNSRHSGATLLPDQPGACSLNIIEGPATAGADVTHDDPKACQPISPVVQVRCDGQKSFGGKPIGLITQVLAHPRKIMGNDNPWPRRVHCGH